MVVLGYDKRIELVSSDGKVLGTILGNVDGVWLRIFVGTDLESFDGSFGFSYDVKLEGLVLKVSQGSTDSRVPGSEGFHKCRISS